MVPLTSKHRRNRIFCCLIAVYFLLLPNPAKADDAIAEGTAASAAESLRVSESETLPLDAAAYDWTGNGIVDAVDAEAMLMASVGKIPSYETLRASLSEGLLGEQFLDKFSYTEPYRGTDGSFRNEQISIDVKRVRERIGDRWVVYYLADIFLRDLSCLRTAVSEHERSGTDPVLEMAQENNAILAMSGDFYRARSRGLAIRNGELIRSSVDRNRDVCVIYRDGVMETVLAGKVDVDAMMDRGVWQAWSFGPALLDADGLPKTKFNTNVAKRNPRAAIGYYAPGHYCFLVVDGRQRSYSYGVSMEQLSQLMYDIGCSVAYNLDGGATAVMSTAEDVLNQRRNENRECSDIVYIGDITE